MDASKRASPHMRLGVPKALHGASKAAVLLPFGYMAVLSSCTKRLLHSI